MVKRCFIKYIAYFDGNDGRRGYIFEKVSIYGHLFGYGYFIDGGNGELNFSSDGKLIYDDLVSKDEFNRGYVNGCDIIRRGGWLVIFYGDMDIESFEECRIETYKLFNIIDGDEEVLNCLLG